MENNLNCNYYSNISHADTDTLELLFLYIDDYRHFKKFSLNLNAKYIFVYNTQKNLLEIKDNPNFINLYPENINLKILCGKNGAGKTSIMQLLRKDIDFYKKCFVVYKNSQGYFYTNKKNLKINYKGNIICCNKDNYSTRCQYFNYDLREPLLYKNEDNYLGKFCKLYLKIYKDLNKSLKKEYRYYFNCFEIGFYDLDYLATYLQTSLETRYNISIKMIGGLADYCRKNPVKYILLLESLDSGFSDLHQEYIQRFKKLNFKNEVDILENILKNIYGCENYSNICKLNEKLIKIIYNSKKYKQRNNNQTGSLGSTISKIEEEKAKYSILNEYRSGYFQNYENKLKEIEQEINTIYKSRSNCNLQINLDQFFYFQIYKKTNTGKIYFSNLSSGEQQKFIILLNLYHKTVGANDLAKTTIFNDDVEIYFHPEWCREFLSLYIKTFSHFTKKHRKIYNVIMATHSPFILSDTTNDYVEFIEKNRNNRAILSKDIKAIENTFAGNIMQMFEENFFLTSSIGEYGISILKEILNYLEGNKLNKPIILKNKLTKNQKNQICAKIIANIGDKILKHLMEEKYKKALNCGKI